MELALVVALWSAGVAFAVATPLFFLWRYKRSWTRLAHTRAHIRGDVGFDPVVLDHALLAFEDAWRQAGFDGWQKLMPAFERLGIEMRRGQFFTEPGVLDPKTKEPLKMRGLTRTQGFIVVAVWEGATVGDIALFHELTHVALWVTKNEPDPDHSGNAYSGWTDKHDKMIEELKAHHRVKDGGGIVAFRMGGVKQGLSVAKEFGVVDCGSCA